MRIVIDADVCTGHGRCYTLAPEVFAANDDDGHSELVGDGTVPEALEAAAKRAALNCPERAITVFDD